MYIVQVSRLQIVLMAFFIIVMSITKLINWLPLLSKLKQFYSFKFCTIDRYYSIEVWAKPSPTPGLGPAKDIGDVIP